MRALICSAVVIAWAGMAHAQEVVRLLGPMESHLGAWTASVEPSIIGPYVWAPGPIMGIQVTRDGQVEVIPLPPGPEDPGWTITAGDTITIELAWRVVLQREGAREQIPAGERTVAVCRVIDHPLGRTGRTIPLCE